MNEHPPYNDEQWQYLPLPDGDAAWQKMELLLEKKKRRRVPPFWLWRYAAIGLLLTGSAVGGWFLLKENDDTATADSIKKVTRQHSPSIDTATIEPVNKPRPAQSLSTPTEQLYDSITDAPTAKELAIQKKAILGPSAQPKKIPPTAITTSSTESRNANPVRKKSKTIAEKKAKEKTNKEKTQAALDGDQVVTPRTELHKDVGIKTTKNSLLTQEMVSTKYTANLKDTATIKPAPPIVSADTKKEKQKNKNAFSWSAGAGLQQAIAVNGQQSSSYNYRGKQSSLSDHLPSVYVRLQKNKWFLQGEFVYGSPQPVKNFSFSQRTTYDATTNALNTERFSIQKLYYHQLPFSINFYPLPNLSVGAGAVYNILAGAVTEQQVTARNVATGVESTSIKTAPVKGYKDSFLYKTTAGVLLQTDYHWKRFSLGLRYTKNLQPFIKYTKPNGEVMAEKTQALQAVLRFRLWRSE